jgi:catechol 2,3-dioxygenase-like lactoylglutathione lyase family enzyme
MIKFDHMSLPVSNPEASRDWYVANLGFRVEFEVPERRTYALVDDADFTIFVLPATGALGEARPAFTLQVDDVDAKHAELAAKGVAFVGAPAKHYWGYGAELDDPDGYRLMLWDEVSMREKGGSAG